MNALGRRETALGNRAVDCDQPARVPNTAPCSKALGDRLQCAQQLMEALACRPPPTGVQVGEDALDTGAACRPAILGYLPGRMHLELLAAHVTFGQPDDKGLNDGGDRDGVGGRGLAVRNAELERAEAKVRAKLPPPRARLVDCSKCLYVLLPGVQHWRYPLAREELRELWTDRRESRVAALVVGRVGGERSEQRQVRTRGVVHGQRALGVADGDVDLERAYELALSERAVLLDRALVARGAIQLSHAGAVGMDASGGELRKPLARRDECPPRVKQEALKLVDTRACGGGDLQLRGGKFELEAIVAIEPIQHLLRSWRELEALWLEQHHLVLDPDRVGRDAVEQRSELCGGRDRVCLQEAEDRSRLVRLLPLPGVFRPHSDSWLLAQMIEREPLPKAARVLDLCAGSGVLAITAARAGAAQVVAVDVSRRALLAIHANATLNDVRVRALRGDLFEPVGAARFDLIVSNPPYVPSFGDELPARGASRAWEGGRHGRAFIDRICRDAAAHLTPGGVLLLVHSSICDQDQTVSALVRGGLDAVVVERRDGGLGPLMRSRRRLFESTSEELVVIRARRVRVENERTRQEVSKWQKITDPA